MVLDSERRYGMIIKGICMSKTAQISIKQGHRISIHSHATIYSTFCTAFHIVIIVV